MKERSEDWVLLQPFPGNELDAIACTKSNGNQRDIPVATMMRDNDVFLARIEVFPSPNTYLEQDENGKTKSEDY